MSCSYKLYCNTEIVIAMACLYIFVIIAILQQSHLYIFTVLRNGRILARQKYMESIIAFDDFAWKLSSLLF